MLHQLGDKTYHCEYAPRPPVWDRDFLLSYREGRILMGRDSLPRLDRLGSRPAKDDLRFLFSISGAAFFLPSAPYPEEADLQYESIRVLRSFSPSWQAFAGVTGYHLDDWYRRHRYCGACASPLTHKEDERALICPKCGSVLYPQISPAVIVGVVDGDRILFTKYASGQPGHYALVAGYVEIGETFEDAVRREVMEEVGLRVKNIRYCGSQPWGFSQSVLAGFFADLASPGGSIVLETRELSEARWVRREDIPPEDAPMSLTAHMMQLFRTNRQNDSL